VVIAFTCAVPVGQARDGAAKRARDVVFAGQTEQGLPGYVKLLPHGAGVTAAFTYTTFCSGGDGSILWSGVSKATVKKGHFHFVRKEDAKGPRITLDGNIGTTGASGTWQVHFSTRTKLGTVTDVCDSGQVHWTLPRDGAGGQVATGYPIALRLGKTTVKTMGVVTQVNCESGDSYLIPTFYANFPLAKDGTFGRKFSDTGVPNKGLTSKLDVEFRGQLRRGKAHGTWQLKAVFSDKNGKEVDRCDSGQMNWTAVA